MNNYHSRKLLPALHPTLQMSSFGFQRASTLGMCLTQNEPALFRASVSNLYLIPTLPLAKWTHPGPCAPPATPPPEQGHRGLLEVGVQSSLDVNRPTCSGTDQRNSPPPCVLLGVPKEVSHQVKDFSSLWLMFSPLFLTSMKAVILTSKLLFISVPGPATPNRDRKRKLVWRGGGSGETI